MPVDEKVRKLHFSERKLWDECPAARPVLQRLVRHRESLQAEREARERAEARVAELNAEVVELATALRRVMEFSGTSQMQYKIAQAALKGKGAE